MKQTAMVMMTLGVSAALAAPARSVTVCLTADANLVAFAQAQGTTSRLFDDRGVKVNWRGIYSCTDSPDAIKISISYKTPATKFPGALAYALPFEGTHIVMFYDRILAAGHEELLPQMLAYVMVHEITHILQGVDRHSETGIMKAHWTHDDYYAMRQGKLSFAAIDVALIQTGLDKRASEVAGTKAVLVASR